MRPLSPRSPPGEARQQAQDAGREVDNSQRAERVLAERDGVGSQQEADGLLSKRRGGGGGLVRAVNDSVERVALDGGLQGELGALRKGDKGMR